MISSRYRCGYVLQIFFRVTAAHKFRLLAPIIARRAGRSQVFVLGLASGPASCRWCAFKEK